MNIPLPDPLASEDAQVLPTPTRHKNASKSGAHRHAVIISTVTSLIASGLFAQTLAEAAEKSSTEACYGIAKAGQNSCATAKHGCSTLAAKDNQPDEWIEVPVGSCKARGGSLQPLPSKEKTSD